MPVGAGKRRERRGVEAGRRYTTGAPVLAGVVEDPTIG
jgi:hypothetical protein